MIVLETYFTHLIDVIQGTYCLVLNIIHIYTHRLIYNFLTVQGIDAC